MFRNAKPEEVCGLVINSVQMFSSANVQMQSITTLPSRYLCGEDVPEKDMKYGTGFECRDCHQRKTLH